MKKIPKIFFSRKFVEFVPVRKCISLGVRISNRFDRKKDLKTCGCSLTEVVRSKYRESHGATNSQSTSYWALEEIIGKAPQFSKDDVLLDVGCGKGRVRVFYWCGARTGDYLDGRPGWKKIRRDWFHMSHGLFMCRWPQRYTNWEYTP